MKLYTPETLPTTEGLYLSANGQVWELCDDETWSEIHGDGAEFGDHALTRLVPEVSETPMSPPSVTIPPDLCGIEGCTYLPHTLIEGRGGKHSWQ